MPIYGSEYGHPSALVLRKNTDTIRPMKSNASLFQKSVRASIALCLATLAVAAPHRAGAADQPAVALQQIAEGFVSPLNLVSLADGSGRLLIADQVGTIARIDCSLTR